MSRRSNVLISGHHNSCTVGTGEMSKCTWSFLHHIFPSTTDTSRMMILYIPFTGFVHNFLSIIHGVLSWVMVKSEVWEHLVLDNTDLHLKMEMIVQWVWYYSLVIQRQCLLYRGRHVVCISSRIKRRYWDHGDHRYESSADKTFICMKIG